MKHGDLTIEQSNDGSLLIAVESDGLSLCGLVEIEELSHSEADDRIETLAQEIHHSISVLDGGS